MTNFSWNFYYAEPAHVLTHSLVLDLAMETQPNRSGLLTQHRPGQVDPSGKRAEEAAKELRLGQGVTYQLDIDRKHKARATVVWFRSKHTDVSN